MSLFDPRALGAKPGGLRRERIEASPRYKNGRFENTQPVSDPLAGQPLGKRVSIIGEFFFANKGMRRPPGELPIASPLEAWSRPADTGFRATWLGHSTVLLELDGFRVLTDPVWAERISPASFAGPKRFHRAPVPVASLPHLDAVVVSHDHYDHLDYPTILELAKRDVPFVTSLGVGAHLEMWGVSPNRITELEWWETATFAGGRLAFTAAPSRHFSGRGTGANRTAWSSFVVRTDNHKVFFSGDTGLTTEFEEIGRRLGPFDMTMLEVGAFHPSWGTIHLGPENALKAHAMLGGGTLLPVHWGTFDLALHAWDEPIETLSRLAAEQRVHVVTPRLGSAIEPSRVERIEPWWREVHAPVTASALPSPA